MQQYYWFESYRHELEEDRPTQTNEVKNEGVNFGMNTEILEKLTNAIESISDTHKIEFAEQKIETFIKDFMNKNYANIPKTYDVRVTEDKVGRVEGVTHKIFPKVCKLINRPRSKKDAKNYYRIE